MGRTYYPCNGGAFFWVSAHDTGGSWSQIVSNEILPYSGCSNEGPTTSPKPSAAPNSPVPIIPPTEAPTLPPVPPTSAPTQSTTTPTIQPTECVDKPKDKFHYKMKNQKPINKTCKWLGKKSQKSIDKICKKNNDSHDGIGPAKEICKVLCGTCPHLILLRHQYSQRCNLLLHLQKVQCSQAYVLLDILAWLLQATVKVFTTARTDH